MRLIMLVMIFTITLISCQTTKKYINVPLTQPPSIYNIPKIDTDKDLIKAYQNATIKIAQWQSWFNVQVNSNYYNYNRR
ncbi:putative protein [Brachyspira pilosicoli WesB]|mgnify:CR=1 FL=1|uniref:Lipoprotein n=1 Tax=Brachyspira pilosicoli WesB TaxID=1161918 RepID=K0JIT3_BRAPL|nr:hypothetical protein [Brachyspira pilosicoli]CCG56205.1 putative protein [Brachyspira pilosicoli WesB]SUW04288.1 Uncharacterised protein [Brachyspira pilosicoli]SUW07953.1 Uncharacterised protein [Brachyspira pilosicoli]